MKEDLTGALVEPQSNSSSEAKKMGLTYVGFGRYTDNTGQVTHIVQNDKLIPFSKAVKTNSFKQLSGDDYGSYAQSMQPQINQTHQDMTSSYPPENFSNALPSELGSKNESCFSAVLPVNGWNQCV